MAMGQHGAFYSEIIHTLSKCLSQHSPGAIEEGLFVKTLAPGYFAGVWGTAACGLTSSVYPKVIGRPQLMCRLSLAPIRLLHIKALNDPSTHDSNHPI